MEKAGKDIKGQKARISKLAIASVAIPLVICIASLYTIFSVQGRYSGILILDFVAGPIVLVSFYLAPVAFLLGFLSLVKIKMSRGLLKGYIFGCAGLLLSVVSWDYGMIALVTPRRESRIQICQENMRHFAEGLRSYSNDYYGKYPAPEKWCDLLVEYKGAWYEDHLFLCPARSEERQAGYAINPKATPNSASDVVLVFGANCGWERCWNRFGGPETLTFENHRRVTLLTLLTSLPFKRGSLVGGCNILFNDGSVEFIYPEQLSDLDWGDDQHQ